MATEKVEEVPSAEPSVEEVPQESVEEKLSELKLDAKPLEQPVDPTPNPTTNVDTPAPEEKEEEKAPEAEEAAPEPKVLEVVETVDTQTPAPDATTEPASREVPTEVVHETTDAPHKPTLVEKISSIFHNKST